MPQKRNSIGCEEEEVLLRLDNIGGTHTVDGVNDDDGNDGNDDNDGGAYDNNAVTSDCIKDDEPTSIGMPPTVAKVYSLEELLPWRIQRFLHYRLGAFSAHYLLLYMCLYVIVQSMVAVGLTASSFTSLEVRYGLSSSQTGGLATTYEISVTAIVVAVGIYGTKGHKGRGMAVGLLCVSLGSFVFAIPHLLHSSWSPISSKISLNDSSTLCVDDVNVNEQTSQVHGSFSMLILGQLIIGIGSAPIYILGPTMLDESVHAKSLPLHLGLFYGASALGPALGFFLNSYFLSLFVDLSHSGSLTSSEPTWVGAWWVGFIGCTVFAMLFAIPFMVLPLYLPGTDDIRAAKAASTDIDVSALAMTKKKKKNLIASISVILSNKTWIFNTLGVSAETLVISALAMFMPKFISKTFDKTASESSVIFGALVVSGAVAGNLFGGWLSKKLALTTRGNAKATVIFTSLTTVSTLFFLIGCPDNDIAGIQVAYPNLTNVEGTLVSGCNAACNCDSKHYEPMCGTSSQLSFFNPCFAGCSRSAGNQSFFDCRCDLAVGGSVTRGPCNDSCGVLVPLMILVFVAMFLSFMSTVPSMQTLLGCLMLEHRSLGLGLQSVVFRVLGGIPGPVFLGKLIDLTCIHWDSGHAGQDGNCWLYNETRLRYTFFLYALIGKIVAVICFSLSLWCYVPLKNATRKGLEELNEPIPYRETEVEEEELVNL